MDISDLTKLAILGNPYCTISNDEDCDVNTYDVIDLSNDKRCQSIDAPTGNYEDVCLNNGNYIDDSIFACGGISCTKYVQVNNIWLLLQNI